MYPALHPVTLMLYAAAFVATALVTARRPAYGAATLAFFIPFTFSNSVADTSVSLPKVILLGALTGLIQHRAAIAPLLRGAQPIWFAFAGMIAAIALSMLGAEYRVDVLREALKWTEYGLVFAIIYVSYRLDPDDDVFEKAIYLSIGFVSLSALAQEAIGSPSQIDFGRGVATRIAGALEGPNQLGGYLEVAIAFAAAFQARKPCAYFSTLLVLAGATLMLTFSRGAMLGCAVAVLTIALIERAAILRLVPLYAGLALGAAGDAVWMRAAQTLPALHNVSYGRDNAGGVGHRAELWRAAWFFFRHHPLVGIGAGNYERRLPEAGLFNVRTHANNLYLQALAEGGIVLFAATVALLGTILVQLRTAVTRSPWALAALAATLALIVHQSVDYLFFYPKVAEAWLVLVALGVASRSGPSTAQVREANLLRSG